MPRKPDLVIVPKDHSFRLKLEEDLLSAFSEKDQKRVLPPQGIGYPVNAQHYLYERIGKLCESVLRHDPHTFHLVNTSEH